MKRWKRKSVKTFFKGTNDLTHFIFGRQSNKFLQVPSEDLKKESKQVQKCFVK